MSRLIPSLLILQCLSLATGLSVRAWAEVPGVGPCPTLDTVRATVGQETRVTGGASPDWRWMYGVTERLGAHPEAALDLPATLTDASDVQAAVRLVAGIAASGTWEAQAALVSIATGGLDPLIRTAALVGLGNVEAPDPTLLYALLTEALRSGQATRDVATLALGHAIRGIGDREIRSRMLDALIDAWLSATDPERQATLIKAMGHTRAPEIVSVMEVARRSSDVRIRAAAAQALGHVEDRRVDTILVEMMLGDSHEDVRRNAILAVRARALQNFTPALAISLENDPAPRVRKAALSVLSVHVGAAIAEVLTSASIHDPDPSIRALAQATLVTVGPDS